MKIPNPPRHQYIGFWLSMPFIVLAWCYILYDNRLFHDWKVCAVTYPIIYLIGYCSWRMHGVYDHYIRKKFPSLDETHEGHEKMESLLMFLWSSDEVMSHG